MSFSGSYINTANEKAGLIIENSGSEHNVKVLTDTATCGTFKVRGQGNLTKEKDVYRAEIALSDGRKLLLEVVPEADFINTSLTYVSDMDDEGMQAVEQYRYKKVPDGSIKV